MVQNNRMILCDFLRTVFRELHNVMRKGYDGNGRV